MNDYKCIKDVVMNHNGSIEFTKGKIYTTTGKYGGGYLFENNSHRKHRIPIMFLEEYFEEIDDAGLDFKIL